VTIFSQFRLMLCLRFLAADIPKFGVKQVPSRSLQKFFRLFVSRIFSWRGELSRSWQKDRPRRQRPEKKTVESVNPGHSDYFKHSKLHISRFSDKICRITGIIMSMPILPHSGAHEVKRMRHEHCAISVSTGGGSS